MFAWDVMRLRGRGRGVVRSQVKVRGCVSGVREVEIEVEEELQQPCARLRRRNS